MKTELEVNSLSAVSRRAATDNVLVATVCVSLCNQFNTRYLKNLLIDLCKINSGHPLPGTYYSENGVTFGADLVQNG